MCSQHPAARFGLWARARHHLCPPALHQVAAIGLLLIADPHHVDFDLQIEKRSRQSQSRAPLSGPCLRGEPPNPGLFVVVGLGHGGVGLVAAGRADTLVFVVNMCRRIERFLQAPSAIERGWPPQAINLPHGVRDGNFLFSCSLLLQDLIAEQRRQIRRSNRLVRDRVQRRRRGMRQERDNVEPGLRDLGFVEEDLGCVCHGLTPVRVLLPGGKMSHFCSSRHLW